MDVIVKTSLDMVNANHISIVIAKEIIRFQIKMKMFNLMYGF